METKRRPPVRGQTRLDPTLDKDWVHIGFRVLPTVCLALTFILVVRVASFPLRNPDTWFHLTIGRALLRGSWSLRDPGSLSSFATEPWLPTQWSVQVAAAGVEGWFGLPGVAWMFGVLELILVATVYLVCRQEAAPLASSLATVAVVFGASSALSARPQVVSLILLTLTLLAWLRTRIDLRARWWLVPLTWVWATAHGFWSIAVLLGVVCCAGLLIEGRVNLRVGARLLAVPFLSLVAACLTPVGPALLTTQFVVSSRSGFISEWAPTSFRDMAALVTAAMLALTAAIWARRGGTSWLLLLLLLFAAVITAYAVRMVALGAVIGAPLVSGALQGLLPKRSVGPSRGELLGLSGAVLSGALLLGLFVPHTADEPGNVPVGLTNELAALPAGTAVIVDATTGSWLEWRFPELNPTMDGMFDGYTLDYMREYQGALDLEPGWKRFIARTGAQVAVLTQGGSLTHAMKDSLDWQQLDRDGRWVFLEAPVQ